MRYVIVNPVGAFYSGNAIASRRDSIEVDGVGTKTVHSRPNAAPEFKAHDASGAVKFDTESDATAHLTHGDLHDPKAFDGCSVKPEVSSS